MLSLFGKSKQFQQQLETKWKKLYRVAYSWCHDPQLASDLVQETLMKALKHRSQIRELKSLDAWLFKIMANCWRDYCRRSKNTVDIDDVTLIHEDNIAAEQ
ncbi:RNA polymerase sigma factor, partial [Kaarinaea lacus]